MLLRAAAVTAAAPRQILAPRRSAQIACGVLGGRLDRRWAATSEGSSGDKVVVAYPGSPGSLSNIGAKQFFRGRNADFQGVTSIANTFDAVSKGEASFGVIPAENSSSGTVHLAYDQLLQHDVVIAGDLGVHEKYCLCVKPGVDMESIRSVTSHPVILDACSEFISQKLQPGQDLRATRTTCEAAISIASSDNIAAIATHEAATVHGLTVLATDIGNDVFLETRYILIRRSTDERVGWSMPSHLQHSDVARKSSACFALNNEPSSLFKLLSCWALRDINVVKVESRPLASRTIAATLPRSTARLWDHIYYVDHIVPAGQSEEEARQLWAALCGFSNWQRDFGTYSSLVSRTEKRAKTWDQMYQTMTWG